MYASSASSHKHVDTRKQPRKDEVSSSCTERPRKRMRTVWRSISDARVESWTENGEWPRGEEENRLDQFQALLRNARPFKRSLRRMRSDTSLNYETVQTQTRSVQQLREQKIASYRHPRYEGQLQERRSFMKNHDDCIAIQSKELLAKLLTTSRKPPDNTLFSDDIVFEKTYDSLRGENETEVILRIGELIFPSAESLALRGSKHLEMLRETTNVGWINAIPFHGPHPQPDFGLGSKREVFISKRLIRKLEPLICNEIEDCSYVAATYNMYVLFFTSEVKCGASALHIADRQNLHSQTVALRQKVELFRLLGQLHDFHREVDGF
jgi:hypothetical protein